VVLAFTTVVKADISLSGYQEFFVGSADQSIASSTTNHGIDMSGMSNGNYTSTLDSGL